MDEEMMNNEISSQTPDDSENDDKMSESDSGDNAQSDEENDWSNDEPWPAEDEKSDRDDWEESPASSPDENKAREIKVALDWVELEGALENNSPELHSFLNTVTGDVIRIFEGGENADVRLKQVEVSPDYIYVDPVSSREQYRWMEEFIEIVEEPTLKDKLNIAIDGKGAFRRFKDVLVGYPVERERWFAKRSVKLRAHMTDWLASKHVAPTNTPPWEGGEGETAGSTEEERKPPRADAEPRNWRENNTDLRTAAHELVDLVPSRELPTAVAFLEFLRGRRGFRRPRFG